MGLFLVRSEDAGFAAGEGDGAGEVFKIGVEHVPAGGVFGGDTAGARGVVFGSVFMVVELDPFGVDVAGYGRGPHRFDFRREGKGEGDGADGVELEERHDAGAILLRALVGEENFFQRESDVGISDGGVVGGDGNFSSGGVDVNGDIVAFDLGLDGEVTDELDGEDPGFEAAILLTEESATFAGDGEGFFRFDVLAESNGVVGERENGKRFPGRWGLGEGGEAGKKKKIETTACC